jgi:hypothetical protein
MKPATYCIFYLQHQARNRRIITYSRIRPPPPTGRTNQKTVQSKDPRNRKRDKPKHLKISPVMRTSLLTLFLISTGITLAAGKLPNPQNATPASAKAQASDDFAQRAQQTVQMFTDRGGRKLAAEIIKVNAGTLEVRRQADQRILTVPVAMLCNQDQDFAAYLWKQKELKKSTTPPAAEQTLEKRTPSNAAKKYSLRAQKPTQTFSDKAGRKLVAQIISIQNDSLEIRRVADDRIMQLPVSYLCADDKAFAAYLWKQQSQKRAHTAQAERKTSAQPIATNLRTDMTQDLQVAEAPTASMADKVWASLF